MSSLKLNSRPYLSSYLKYLNSNRMFHVVGHFFSSNFAAGFGPKVRLFLDSATGLNLEIVPKPINYFGSSTTFRHSFSLNIFSNKWPKYLPKPLICFKDATIVASLPITWHHSALRTQCLKGAIIASQKTTWLKIALPFQTRKRELSIQMEIVKNRLHDNLNPKRRSPAKPLSHKCLVQILSLN